MTTKEEISEPEILISEDLDKSSEIYMVCLDCEPMFYCLELKEARQEAERLAKKNDYKLHWRKSSCRYIGRRYLCFG